MRRMHRGASRTVGSAKVLITVAEMMECEVKWMAQ